jgi:hypothetical protein
MDIIAGIISRAINEDDREILLQIMEESDRFTALDKALVAYKAQDRYHVANERLLREIVSLMEGHGVFDQALWEELREYRRTYGID